MHPHNNAAAAHAAGALTIMAKMPMTYTETRCIQKRGDPGSMLLVDSVSRSE
jgi:hypothetical protein